MKLNIMHPLYVVAGLSSQSEPGNEQVGVIEYSAEGARLVGHVHQGANA